MKKPDIFTYIDYRNYLKDLFCYFKETKKNFSYRYFAGKAGFKSVSFLKHVIEGERNLSSTSISGIAKAFGLKNRERDFFENLVFLNQAKTHDEKDHYYRKLVMMNPRSNTNTLSKEQYDYFSKWFYPAIREIVAFNGGDISENQIAAILNPKITVPQVEHALKQLQNMGLIKKNGEGKWEQTNKALNTGSEVKSLIITNYHKKMIAMSSESIDRCKAAERDINALTICINQNKITEVKKIIMDFKNSLKALEVEETDPNQVIQINIQAFPLTNVYRRRSK